MRNGFEKVISQDSTSIAFERTGEGPPLVLVMGAFNDRSTGAPLAGALSPRFTVYTYDRRGRGDSGDTLPYAIEREIEDLNAIIAEAGSSPAVFGYSSGAVLALKAAWDGLSISKRPGSASWLRPGFEEMRSSTSSRISSASRTR
jgi:pimeloyl-ACP methyl ester carboxylesterase